MYNFESEKHCPKCGGKMMDLVLTSYPGQSISKCWSCGYEEIGDIMKKANAKKYFLACLRYKRYKLNLLNNATERGVKKRWNYIERSVIKQ